MEIITELILNSEASMYYASPVGKIVSLLILSGVMSPMVHRRGSLPLGSAPTTLMTFRPISSSEKAFISLILKPFCDNVYYVPTKKMYCASVSL